MVWYGYDGTVPSHLEFSSRLGSSRQSAPCSRLDMQAVPAWKGISATQQHIRLPAKEVPLMDKRRRQLSFPNKSFFLRRIAQMGPNLSVGTILIMIIIMIATDTHKYPPPQKNKSNTNTKTPIPETHVVYVYMYIYYAMLWLRFVPCYLSIDVRVHVCMYSILVITDCCQYPNREFICGAQYMCRSVTTCLDTV